MTVRMALLVFLVWGRMCCRAGLPWAPSEGQGRTAPAARDGCRLGRWGCSQGCPGLSCRAAPAALRALCQGRGSASCPEQQSSCVPWQPAQPSARGLGALSPLLGRQSSTRDEGHLSCHCPFPADQGLRATVLHCCCLRGAGQGWAGKGFSSGLGCLSPCLAQLLLALLTGSLAMAVAAAGSGAALGAPPVQGEHSNEVSQLPLPWAALGRAGWQAGNEMTLLKQFHGQDPCCVLGVSIQAGSCLPGDTGGQECPWPAVGLRL